MIEQEFKPRNGLALENMFLIAKLYNTAIEGQLKLLLYEIGASDSGWQTEHKLQPYHSIASSEITATKNFSIAQTELLSG